jgi:chromosome segregation ATPase
MSTFLGVPLETLGATGIWGFIFAAVFGIGKLLNDSRKTKADAHKTHADADKAEVEATALVIAGLQVEIGRLQERGNQLERQLQVLRDDIDSRITHEAKLEQENRALRGQVERQGRRISALEAVFRIHPVPPAMQAELDRIGNSET